MKTLYFLLLGVILSLGQAQAQLSVLFVDDSTDGFGNAEKFHAALDSVGYAADYWNAADSTRGPSDLEMASYDLVVWHTSSIDNTLYFWNATDSENAALQAYLDGGGKLWVVGNDFLFDRYGVAPVTFEAADFPSAYLGITSYDSQSNANDGGLGVSPIEPADGSPIADLNTLTFIFPSLYWVDGVTLAEENAAPVYTMGGAADYPLLGSVCGSYYDNGTFTTLAYYFDLSLAADFDMLKASVLPVMSHFDGLVSSNDDLPLSIHALNIFPNPSHGPLSLQLELKESASIAIDLVDLHGRVVRNLQSAQQWSAGLHQYHFNLSDLRLNGMYYLHIQADQKIISRPLILHF